jgi:hypothetical protein
VAGGAFQNTATFEYAIAMKPALTALKLQAFARQIHDCSSHIFFPLKPDRQRSKPKPSTFALVGSPQLLAQPSHPVARPD